MKKKVISVVLGITMFFSMTGSFAVKTEAATTSKATVSTWAELSAALDDEKVSEITVTKQITIPTDSTIDGRQEVVIKAAVTGTNCMGIANDNPTDISLFKIASGSTVTITDVTIYGGAQSAIVNYGTLNVTGTTMTRCGSDEATGSAINNYGTAKLVACNIYRNVAMYGAAFLNQSGATMVQDRCAVTENRNIGDGSWGGGACENKGTLYMNNCTYSNNQSTEIGGAINNHNGKLYMTNTTMTGNITSETAEYGGGIGVNGGTVTVVNSIILDNYAFDGSNAVSSDIGIYSTGTVSLINTRYGTNFDSYSIISTTDCLSGEDSDQFNDYRDKYRLGADGIKVDDTTYTRPVIFRSNETLNSADSIFVPLASGTNDLTTADNCTWIYFDYSDMSNIAMGYGTDDSITSITTTAPAKSNKITVFQDGLSTNARSDTNQTLGSYFATTDIYYDVIATVSDEGDIDNASIYGDSYKAGSETTIYFDGNGSYSLDKVQYYDSANSQWVDFDNSKDVLTLTMNQTYTIRGVYVELNVPATGGEITTYHEGDTGIAVWGKVKALSVSSPDDGIFCVVIQWGSLQYDYSFGTWDADNYQYTGAGWTAVDNGNSDKITVINKSTVGVNAAFTFSNIGGNYNAVDGGFYEEAAYTTARTDFDLDDINDSDASLDTTDSNYLQVTGTPSVDSTDDYVRIGTVTVTISQN